MLDNLPPYMQDVASSDGNDDHSILEELERRKHFQLKGRPPYSAAMIRYALFLRYTSTSI